jgi:hypothetical protein
MEELFSLMSSVPLVKYSILSYFQRLKLDNNELIDKALGKNTGHLLFLGEEKKLTKAIPGKPFSPISCLLFLK